MVGERQTLDQITAKVSRGNKDSISATLFRLRKKDKVKLLGKNKWELKS
jgi:hypothetical protein